MFDPVYRALESGPCASTAYMWSSEANCGVSPLYGFQGWSPGCKTCAAQSAQLGYSYVVLLLFQKMSLLIQLQVCKPHSISQKFLPVELFFYLPFPSFAFPNCKPKIRGPFTSYLAH